MLNFIKCSYCNESYGLLDKITVDLNFNRTIKCCKHCNNMRRESESYNFCSIECFQYFIKEKYDFEKSIAI